jgi:hypothetical protein
MCNEARILGGKQVRHRTLNLSLSLVSAVGRLLELLSLTILIRLVCRLANQRPEGRVRGWCCTKPEG